jgi:hypothetical protein
VTGRTALIIPDAGPLISLGKADRLEVLLKPGLPLYIVDQVLYEATRDPRHVDARRIAAFVRSNSRAVAARRAAGETGRQKGQGEAALAEFLARLDEVLDHPYDRALLLFEDSDIRTGVFLTAANVDLVSTRALLRWLERRRLIRSAEEIWQAIEAAGREPSAADVDTRPPGLAEET